MTEKQKNFVWAILCSAFYMIIFWNLIPFVYGIADDRSMMEIVSGQYLGHPDAHTIFMGYWYSLFLTGLYRLTPSVDWYALGFLLLQGLCMSLMLYRSFCIIGAGWRKKASAAAVILLTFTALGLRTLTQLTFTTTAAVLGITVIFWYMTSWEIRGRDLCILFLLCFLTSQVRQDIFYMILPVCGVLWVFRIVRPEQRSIPHLLIPAASALVILLGILGHQVGYGSDGWKVYQRYDQNRTLAYDYPDYAIPSYEGAEDFYHQLGIEKKSRARNLFNYNYTADDQITQEFFEEYVSTYREMYPSRTTMIGKAVQSLKEYVKGVLSGRFHLPHLLALGLYGVLAVGHLWRKQWLKCGQVICVTGAQLLLWGYLFYGGRTPERVIYSMNLMFVVTALMLVIEALRERKLSEKVQIYGTVAACLLLCVPAILSVKAVLQENQEMSYRNESVEALKEYCAENPENFYFNDVTSLAFSTWNVDLWREEPYEMNYMSLGDWMSFSPIWQEKLDQNGISSVKKALYESENVYLICSFDKGLEYLVSLYDDVNCTEVAQVAQFKIYRLE